VSLNNWQKLRHSGKRHDRGSRGHAPDLIWPCCISECERRNAPNRGRIETFNPQIPKLCTTRRFLRKMSETSSPQAI